MPNDLTPGQREAYARVKTSVQRLKAVEFRHPIFSAPIRLVGAKFNLMAPLEASAPVDAGEIVLFTAYGLRIRDPVVNTDPDTTISIALDGVPGAVQGPLAAANKTIVPIDCSYRYYSYDIKTNSVLGDKPNGTLHLQVRSIVINKTSVGLTLGYTNTANRAFPSALYTPETNPGLSQ